jgi:hypothetical protein
MILLGLKSNLSWSSEEHNICFLGLLSIEVHLQYLNLRQIRCTQASGNCVKAVGRLAMEHDRALDHRLVSTVPLRRLSQILARSQLCPGQRFRFLCCWLRMFQQYLRSWQFWFPVFIMSWLLAARRRTERFSRISWTASFSAYASCGGWEQFQQQ